MKKSKILMALFISVIGTMILAGCQQKDLFKEDAQITHLASNHADITKPDNGQYYLVTEKDGVYSYTIYDKDMKVARFEEGLTKQPTIAMASDRILFVTTQAGTGIATSSTYYYNIDTNQFSPIYQSVLAQYKNLVAYATSNQVIIQDIFENNGYYEEITTFQEPFAPVAFPFVKAEFDNDISNIRITYLSGMEYNEISESFVLERHKTGDGFA